MREERTSLRRDARSAGWTNLGAILVPGDEAVFYLFAADSDGAVRETSARAGVKFERVVESIPVGLPALDGTSPEPQEKETRP